ncbi:hypothetical protein CPB84DRAFT_210871 [Gymnopilus junonius]|uniref:Uncharacterized protein n=1 Tax=Gymnopilus junonius TaxID=109634 RepID=A0A9P5NX56_GYMJU|nr:hypothetical protein CPB84DRAFT_210871 [Gymnopilus junonius]
MTVKPTGHRVYTKISINLGARMLVRKLPNLPSINFIHIPRLNKLHLHCFCILLQLLPSGTVANVDDFPYFSSHSTPCSLGCTTISYSGFRPCSPVLTSISSIATLRFSVRCAAAAGWSLSNGHAILEMNKSIFLHLMYGKETYIGMPPASDFKTLF